MKGFKIPNSGHFNLHPSLVENLEGRWVPVKATKYGVMVHTKATLRIYF